MKTNKTKRCKVCNYFDQKDEVTCLCEKCFLISEEKLVEDELKDLGLLRNKVNDLVEN